ncbi:MAG: hypothetical protein K6F44_01825 [Lachnospiraceae bacterium]|nr:hypothetical protein [Lachnospiraceae bacterium]
MPYLSKYSVKKSRIEHSALYGLTSDDRGNLFCDDSERMHYLFLPPFDGGKEDAEWGRLSFKIDVPDNTEVTIFYFATETTAFTRKHELADMMDFLCETDEDPSIKLELFELAGAKSKRGASDILMYDVRGRFLFVAIRVEGSFKGALSNIRVINPGDTFMITLPEIYRKRGGFYHRYLSVLSSVFNDFQDRIDGYAVNLDPDIADKDLLVTYAGWMGIDLSGDFLDEEKLRMLVKEAPMLNRKKGTKAALERLCEIVLSEKCIVVENKGDSDRRMFGESRFDVTILIKSFVEEKKKSQLFFLLNQFVPIRTHLRIIYLEGRSALDTHSYLDINASVFDTKDGKLDSHMSLDGNVLMPDPEVSDGFVLSDGEDGIRLL